MELLLDNETVGNGIYQADLDDPELCQPFGTCLWEWTLLQHRQESLVIQYVASLLKKKPCPSPSSWEDLLARTEDGSFPAPLTFHRKHGLRSTQSGFLSSLIASLD
jgi:hypothetical protein